MGQHLAVFTGSYRDLVRLFIQGEFQSPFLKCVPYTPEGDEPRQAQIMADLNAQAMLAQNQREVDAIISTWQCYRPEGGDTYVSGLMDASIFSRHLAVFKPEWTGFLKGVPSGAQAFTRSFGFAYVAQAKQVAGCSVLYFPGAPDLWMLFHIVHPVPGEAGEAKMTVVMPAMLFPEEVFGKNTSTIRFHTDDSTEFPWSAFLGNDQVSQVVSLLLADHHCSPDCISLFADNANEPFLWSHTERKGSRYYHLPTLIDFLRVLSPAPVRINTALQHIRENKTLQACVDTFLKSFREWEGKILHRADRNALAELAVLCTQLFGSHLTEDQVARVCLFLGGQYHKWASLTPMTLDIADFKEFDIEILSPKNREILLSRLADAAKVSEEFNTPQECDRDSLFQAIDRLYQDLPEILKTSEEVNEFRLKLLEHFKPYMLHMEHVFKTRGGFGPPELERMSVPEIKALLFPTSRAPASRIRVSTSVLPKADLGDVKGSAQGKLQKEWHDLRHLSGDDLASLVQMLQGSGVNIEIPLTTLNCALHNLLKHLRRSLPWALVKSFEDDTLEIQQGSAAKQPHLLPEGKYREILAALKADKQFEQAITGLVKQVSVFSSINMFVKTIAHAFCQYCETIIRGKITESDTRQALDMLISQYANWKAMTSGIRYPEKIHKPVGVLLARLRQALPDFQEAPLAGTKLTVLVLRQSAPVGPAATFPGPAKSESAAAAATSSFPAP